MLKIFTINFCVLLALSSLAYAEGTVGYDLLALQHSKFPLEKILSEIPNGSALGVLLDTFGDDRSKINEALKSGKFISFRIHLANGPGLRNRQLGEYENLFGLSTKSFDRKIIASDQAVLNSFIERAKYVDDLSTQFPNIKCFISPVLEHNLSPEAFSKLAQIVKNAAPRCLIVNNPVNGWNFQLAQDQFLEVHGVESQPSMQYIASKDGDFGLDEEFLSFHAKAFIKFLWKSSYNCRAPGSFIDPRERINCS